MMPSFIAPGYFISIFVIFILLVEIIIKKTKTQNNYNFKIKIRTQWTKAKWSKILTGTITVY